MLAAFSAACLLYHIRFPLSRGFLKLFLSFFLDRFAIAWLCLSDSFIISHPLSFVKRFFKTFLSFFRTACFRTFRAAVSLTAPLLYHSSHSLSSPLAYLFRLFLGLAGITFFFRQLLSSIINIHQASSKKCILTDRPSTNTFVWSKI